jgi:hypothetical protein
MYSNSQHKLKLGAKQNCPIKKMKGCGEEKNGCSIKQTI